MRSQLRPRASAAVRRRTRLPFWWRYAANAAYGYFVLPESLPPERRKAFSWTRVNPLGSLRLLRSHHELFGIATVSVFYHLAHHVLPSEFVLYGSYRYGWDTRTTGLTLAGVGVVSIIVQGGLVRPMVARFGERRMLLTGLAFGTIGFACFAMAETGAAFWLGIPIRPHGAVWPVRTGLDDAACRGVRAGARQLQGINSSFMGLTGIFGPALFTFTFAEFIGPHADWHLPGAPFCGPRAAGHRMGDGWRVTCGQGLAPA
jgi:DHA1 family tetracycline resistance protein-like MFS transporter